MIMQLGQRTACGFRLMIAAIDCATKYTAFKNVALAEAKCMEEVEFALSVCLKTGRWP